MFVFPYRMREKKGKETRGWYYCTTVLLWWPGILPKLARYPHSGQSSLIVMTTPYRWKRMNRYPTLRHFFLSPFPKYFPCLKQTWKGHRGSSLLTTVMVFFSSFFFFIFFFHLSAAVVPFFRFFYELLLRSLSDIFVFFEKRTIFSGTCKKKKKKGNCNRNSLVLYSLLLPSTWTSSFVGLELGT